MVKIEKIIDVVQIEGGDYDGWWNAFCEMDDGTKIQVLCKKEGRWKEGDEVEMTIRGDLEWEGPDGETDWKTGKFDKPGQQRRGGGGGGGRQGGGRSGGGRQAERTPSAGRPAAAPKAEKLTIATAAAAYDAFFTSSAKKADALFPESPGQLKLDYAKARTEALFGGYVAGCISFTPPAAEKPKEEAKPEPKPAEADDIPF